jgi:CubicO group peptidase (beta-lactamase class C family)
LDQSVKEKNVRHPRRTRILRWIAVGSVAAILAAVVLRPDIAAKAAAGLTAHNLCSAVFVANLAPDSTFEEQVRPLLGPAAVAVRYRIDKDHGFVEASFAGVTLAHAGYRAGEGCQLGRAGKPPTTVVPTLPLGSEPVQTRNAGLARALDLVFAETKGAPIKRVKAVVVLQDGGIIAERYAPGFGPATPLLGWSVAKSVSNALVGVLVRRQRLSVADRDLAPEWTGTADQRRQITLEDLMRMRSGLDAAESGAPTDAVTRMLYTAPDMAAFAASHGLAQIPGTSWSYTSANTLLVDRILGREVGGGPAGLRAFAQRELFGPLGMGDVTMEFDAAGTFIGSSYVYASARSFARFGELYLNDGVTRDGRRILPAGWVAWSRASTLGQPYGAGFWTNDGPSELVAKRVAAGFPKDGFFASGNMGQRIYIVPSQRLVVARFGYSAPPTFGIAHDIDLIAAAIRAGQ